jgi:DMSO/TMAO reductase YedYZ molybdopterin-dependent catalytic subunit
MSQSQFTRRAFLQAALVAPVAFLQGGARYISTLPLGNPGSGPAPPLERLLASGLDARLFTDLSTLSADKPETLLVASQRFYIRPAAPAALDQSPRAIPIGGRVVTPATIDRAAIEKSAVRAGPYLMECAGNADPANYGLMSAARWEGMPLTAALDRVKPKADRYRVLVTGLDDANPSRTSVPGASWIFSRDDLSRALLAVRMNDGPMPPDHGAPVRLIVPGWYGCACIKWVTGIDLVDDDAAATSQMREFAARTHQPFDQPSPSLRASEYNPAVIDTAAMPVRVEKWIAGGRLEYRVTGIIWGGSKPTNALSIRFKTGEPWQRVDDCPLPPSTLTWSLWSHTWRPSAPGRYQIVLKVNDPTIRTRRLDIFFYVREIQIDDV